MGKEEEEEEKEYGAVQEECENEISGREGKRGGERKEGKERSGRGI